MVQDPLVVEALHWLVVLKDRNASAADREAFDHWLNLDPSHLAAWRRAQQVWMRLDRIGPAFRNRPAASSPPHQVAAPWMRQTLSMPLPPRPGHGRRRFLYAAAAVAAIAVPGSVLLTRPGLFAPHVTAVGERRTLALEDGSSIELAGSSSLSVDFAADLRRIVLYEGEAYLDLVRDTARPFVVEAGRGSTRASGAAFDVKMTGRLVTVAVTQKSVLVSANDAEPVTVDEGQLVRYGPNRTGTVGDADLDRVEAWRRDRLVFQNTPLGEVVDDLERYRGGRIIMTDAALRHLPVAGSFDAGQADAAIDTIARSLSIRATRLGNLLVVLSPGD